MRISTITFSCDDNPEYALLWPLQKKHVVKNLGLVPHLTYTGSRSDPVFERMVDLAGGDDMIDVVPRCGEGRWPSPWALFYGTRFLDPDSVVLTMGIDMLLPSMDFPECREVIDSAGDEYFVMLNYSDMWRECLGYVIPEHLRGRDSGCRSTRVCSSFHVAKSCRFQEIYKFEDTWPDEIAKIGSLGPMEHCGEIGHRPSRKESRGPKWGRDETYSTEMLRRWIKEGGLVKTPRGIKCFTPKGFVSHGNEDVFYYNLKNMTLPQRHLIDGWIDGKIPSLSMFETAGTGRNTGNSKAERIRRRSIRRIRRAARRR